MKPEHFVPAFFYIQTFQVFENLEGLKKASYI